MKIRLPSFMRKMRIQKNKGLLKATEIRLTLFNTGLIILFLFVFILVVSFFVYTVIMKNQTNDLHRLTNDEARIVENYIVENNNWNFTEFGDEELTLVGSEQFFYYILSTEGELLAGDELVPQLRSQLLESLDGWVPKPKEIREEQLELSRLDGQPNKQSNENLFSPSNFHQIHLIISGRPIFFQGELIAILFVGKDISPFNQLFHSLLMILAGLAVFFAGVALLISHIMSQKAMIPISNAFHRQQEFLADVSHELRTPLSVLQSSIEVMEMDVEEKEKSFFQKRLRNMKEEVKRMTNLVDDLLSIARSDSGEITLKKERFDFSLLAKNVVESVKPLSIAKHIQVEFSGPTSIFMNGDKEKLAQLLYILLDNAIKYSPIGGKIFLTLTAKKNELQISVQDYGIGIKPEDQSRIFDRFYRSDKSRSRKSGGVGLGLSIGKWIVEQHGGAIQLSSELGKGSTFNVTIPLSR
ncbi:sensor histidine kinase [Fervidibacillus albus]|uniref:histidine kinase n=1 Tax=Fervidibacillus albus TaxID=2980026 RepID=A0A9E8RV92_9BACI|nr:ATP-binding protein [Fervidibacillus albus]WAA09211.1 cell wall metabolism sensor histidine kinase WalK [Fervidibacillus albus]